MEYYYTNSFSIWYLVLTYHLLNKLLTFLFCFLAVSLFLLGLFLLDQLLGLSFPFSFVSSPSVASFRTVFTLLRNTTSLPRAMHASSLFVSPSAISAGVTSTSISAFQFRETTCDLLCLGSWKQVS